MKYPLLEKNHQNILDILRIIILIRTFINFNTIKDRLAEDDIVVFNKILSSNKDKSVLLLHDGAFRHGSEFTSA